MTVTDLLLEVSEHSVLIVPEGAPREVWLEERGEGVTASESWAIARGGAQAWKSILERKMNGSTFRGTKATRAGQAREAALLDEAADLPGIVAAAPNGALWGSPENTLHRATPDGFAMDGLGKIAVVEVKSHAHGYKGGETIPPEHMAQMQWQMHVTGAQYAMYGSEVRDADDQPPADGAHWQRVACDEELIAYLAYRADAFIAWRDAGCPEIDELPADVADALAEWAYAKRCADKWAAEEKKKGAILKTAAKALPFAERFGAVAMGEQGGFQLSITEGTALDEQRWAGAEPEMYAAVQSWREAIADRVAEAARTYPKLTRTETLRFQKKEHTND